jgi:hypothetical protein
MMRIYCTIVALLSAIAGAVAAPSADEGLIADALGNELDRMVDPVDRQQLRELLELTLETDPTFKTDQTLVSELFWWRCLTRSSAS